MDDDFEFSDDFEYEFVALDVFDFKLLIENTGSCVIVALIELLVVVDTVEVNEDVGVIVYVVLADILAVIEFVFVADIVFVFIAVTVELAEIVSVLLNIPLLVNVVDDVDVFDFVVEYEFVAEPVVVLLPRGDDVTVIVVIGVNEFTILNVDVREFNDVFVSVVLDVVVFELAVVRVPEEEPVPVLDAVIVDVPVLVIYAVFVGIEVLLIDALPEVVLLGFDDDVKEGDALDVFDPRILLEFVGDDEGDFDELVLLVPVFVDVVVLVDVPVDVCVVDVLLDTLIAGELVDVLLDVLDGVAFFVDIIVTDCIEVGVTIDDG